MKKLNLGQVLTAFPIIYSFIALFKGSNISDSFIVLGLFVLPVLMYWVEYKKSLHVDDVPVEIKDLENQLRLERARYGIQETKLHHLKQQTRLDEEKARNINGPRSMTF